MELERLAHRSRRWLELSQETPGAARLLPDVLVLQQSAPTSLAAELYEPIVCLILQGAKEVFLGERVINLGPGDLLMVSHDVPVVSRITTARPGEPYLAVILWLDLSVLRGLYEEAGRAADHLRGSDAPDTLAAAEADPRVVDAVARYLALAEDEVETSVLAPAVRREIHFRLLMAPCGAMLRSLLRHNSHASMVAMAISRIRARYRETIAVPELAREIGMSPSSLHKHFRAITATTPLQFQKEMRLLEARRLLLAGHHAVSDVAYEVGYESPNQFSREYSRRYGVPPKSDLRGGAVTR